MIFINSQVRLTRSELNTLRQANALHGFTVNEVRTKEALVDAIIHGLPESMQRDLDTFLENTATEQCPKSTDVAPR